VELIHRHCDKRLSGVANAVLRRLSEIRLPNRNIEGPLGRLDEAHWPKDPAILASLPELLVNDLRSQLSGDGREQLLALNQLPPLCTRTRPGFSPPTGRSIIRQEGEWTWWSDPQEALHGVVAANRAVVQDRSQGYVVETSAARPGQLVLDLCAAPGGKSLAFADRGCRVFAGEMQRNKLARLRENVGTAIPILAQNGTRPALVAAFDIVVADVPCSNTGVLARRPEARLRYHAKALKSLRDIQRNLLESAARLVLPDGKLVYSTCSVTAQENQGIAHNLNGWRILAEHTCWPNQWQAGGYVAVLVRSLK
jgi:16S rRNA (cytosine967-C5)-methyltransferase